MSSWQRLLGSLPPPSSFVIQCFVKIGCEHVTHIRWLYNGASGHLAITLSAILNPISFSLPPGLQASKTSKTGLHQHSARSPERQRRCRTPSRPSAIQGRSCLCYLISGLCIISSSDVPKSPSPSPWKWLSRSCAGPSLQ